mmetsp:Transcript_44589/g.100814  ORF Transcript_44589/g.100814 Transcript_44589/m.100814 type:complete len:102 (+) Transcript_44589:3-308(+)
MGHSDTHVLFMYPLDKLKMMIEGRMPSCQGARSIGVENCVVVPHTKGFYYNVLAVVVVTDEDIDEETGMPTSMAGELKWLSLSECPEPWRGGIDAVLQRLS